MGKWAFYHDSDEYKCAVVREAIKAGAITDGEVVCGDIKQLDAKQLMGFRRVHCFCGGGFWDLALNQAGWPDDREVWTGSCPCPSFSAAGKGEGFADPRHLWPEWFRLIRERRPRSVIGEQVAAAIGHGWLDLVSGDMEEEGYAIAASVLGAHSAGAPHIRQRLYFCAESKRGRPQCEPIERCSGLLAAMDGERRARIATSPCGPSSLSGPDAAHGDRWSGERRAETGTSSDRERRRRSTGDRFTGVGPDAERNGGRSDLAQRVAQGRVADGRDCATLDGSDSTQRGQPMRGGAPGSSGHPAQPDATGSGDDTFQSRLEGQFGDVREWRGPGWLDPHTARSVAEAGATRGFWRDCDWWYGRDGKYRPIKSRLFPLAASYPGRVGLLRLAGDAICVSTAKVFIESYLETERDQG